MACAVLIGIQFVVNHNLNAGSRCDHIFGFIVGQVAHTAASYGQPAILYGIGSFHQVERGGVHHHVSQGHTVIACHLVLDGLNLLERVCGCGGSPQVGGSQRSVVCLFPRAIRVIIVGVVHAIGLDGNTHCAALREQQLHAHAFRHNVSTGNQILLVIVNAVDDIRRIGVIAALGTQNLLAVFFLDLVALAEKRHLGFQLAHADVVTESGLCIKSRGFQGNRQALVALNPCQVKASTLYRGEQTAAQVRDCVGSSFGIVCRNDFRCKKFSKVHVFTSVMRSRRYWCAG